MTTAIATILGLVVSAGGAFILGRVYERSSMVNGLLLFAKRHRAIGKRELATQIERVAITVKTGRAA